MRSLVLAAAVCSAAAPAWAAPTWTAKPPAPISPDPMTVSGRFDLPKAGASPYAGRVRLGHVSVDPAFAQSARLDPHALETAVHDAAARSLQNFGYLAADDATGAIAVDLDVLPLGLEKADNATKVTARMRFKPASDPAACLARTAEGRFTALEREHSGGGRRTFAIGTAVALAFVGVNAGGFVTSELETASAQNRARNAGRQVAVGGGIAPGFSEAAVASFAATAATQLALADYIRQLGEAPACAAASTPLKA